MDQSDQGLFAFIGAPSKINGLIQFIRRKDPDPIFFMTL